MPREEDAVQLHLERIRAGRTPSASPMRRGHRDATPSPSPARSVHSVRSHRSVRTPGSVRSTSRGGVTPRRLAPLSPGAESRYSRLSQRTGMSCCLSSEALELMEAERGRMELRNQIRENERTCREAILSDLPALGVPGARSEHTALTQPMGPQLRVEHRARSRSVTSGARSRSTTPEGRGAAWRGLITSEREQDAIQRHMQRTLPDAALVLQPSAPSASTSSDQLRPPAGVDIDEWVRSGGGSEERAQRARAAAQARHEEAEGRARAKLCIFKQAAPAAPDQKPRLDIPKLNIPKLDVFKRDFAISSVTTVTPVAAPVAPVVRRRQEEQEEVKQEEEKQAQLQLDEDGMSTQRSTAEALAKTTVAAAVEKVQLGRTAESEPERAAGDGDVSPLELSPAVAVADEAQPLEEVQSTSQRLPLAGSQSALSLISSIGAPSRTTGASATNKERRPRSAAGQPKTPRSARAAASASVVAGGGTVGSKTPVHQSAAVAPREQSRGTVTRAQAPKAAGGGAPRAAGGAPKASGFGFGSRLNRF